MQDHQAPILRDGHRQALIAIYYTTMKAMAEKVDDRSRYRHCLAAVGLELALIYLYILNGSNWRGSGELDLNFVVHRKLLFIHTRLRLMLQYDAHQTGESVRN